jgi:hypothetical protein
MRFAGVLLEARVSVVVVSSMAIDLGLKLIYRPEVVHTIVLVAAIHIVCSMDLFSPRESSSVQPPT